MVKPKTTHQIQWVPYLPFKPRPIPRLLPLIRDRSPGPPPFYPFSASFAPCFFWFFTDQDMAHASIPSSHLRSVSGPSSVWRRIARLSVPCQLGVRHRGYSTIECGEAWRMPNEHIGKASSLRPKWRMQRIEFSICFHWPGMVGGIRKTCPMMASQA